jgi:hypothetical protein
MTRGMRIVLVAGTACLCLTSSLFAGPYTFVKVADTGTAIPGSTGNFANFYTNSRVSTDGATIVFTGANASSQVGVYSYDLSGGTLARVADWTTIIPGSASAFASLSEPSVYNGRVGFYGSNNSAGMKGVYTATTTGTGLTAIADVNTAMPGGPGVFSAFDRPSLQGGSLAFYGIYGGNSWSGIYTASDTGGTITKIVDRATMIPGDSNVFTNPGRPSISGSSVAFNGGYLGGSIKDRKSVV